MREKNWPVATKNSVEKLAKEVKDLRKKTDNLTKVSADFDHRLDTMQAAASQEALVVAIRDVAAAIRETAASGLSEADAVEVRNGLAAHVNKLKGVGNETS